MKILYTISLIIAFIPRYGDFIIGKEIRFGIALIWIVFGIPDMVVKQRNLCKKKKEDLRWLLKSYFIPSVFIHLWTVLLMMLGIISWEYFTTNITVYIPTLLAITSICLFGKNSFRYNFYALVIAYGISVFSSICLKGFWIIPYAVMEAYFQKYDGININYLELHDIVLSIGFVLTYYIFAREKITKRNLFIVFCTLIIMALGMKRISILAVFLTVIYHKIVKRLSEKSQYKVCIVSGALALIACYVFVGVIIKGEEFWKITNSLGINPRGRNYYWNAVAERVVFSPGFLGLGRNYTYLLFGNELKHMRVGGGHCDILKMYAECGFFVFGYWLWHYLINMTKRYKRRFSMSSALVYFGMTIYLFVLYLTDNVEVYFASIIFSITIPFCYALKQEGCRRVLRENTLRDKTDEG